MFNLSYLIGKSYSDNDGSQNYLVLRPAFKSSKIFTVTTDRMVGWKFQRMSEESITAPGNCLYSRLNCINNPKIRVKPDGSYLKQDKTSSIHGNVIKGFY